MLKRVLSPRRLVLGVATALAIALVPSLVAAQAATSQWKATLTGANENPPITSTATGDFTATLDEANGTFSWTLNVPNVTNATMAHLHQGAPGTNGSVVLDLFIPTFGVTSTSSINTSSVSREFNLKGPLADNWAGFVAALKAGNIYANVHTTANAGGEIRGQVVSAAATATPTPTATPTATATATATPSATSTPTATATASPTATSTATAAPTGTAVPQPANTGTGGAGTIAPTPLLAVLGLLTVAGAVTVAGRRVTRHRG